MLSPLHERLLALGHDVCDEIGEYIVFLVKRQVWRGIEPGLYFGLHKVLQVRYQDDERQLALERQPLLKQQQGIITK
jgi:hypothetical protein